MPEYDSSVTVYSGYVDLDNGTGGLCYVRCQMRSDWGWTDAQWEALSSAINAAVLAHVPTMNAPGSNAPVVPNFQFSSNFQTSADKVFDVNTSTGALSFAP